MSISAHNPYDEPEQSSTLRWVMVFVLLSLLAHAIIIAAILLITIFMPVPKLAAPEPPTTTLTLEQVQPAPAPQLKFKPIFIPTTPEANAPHKPQKVESANDHDLTSKATVARAPDSFMPDVIGKEHASNLNNSPSVESQKPEVSSTPPTPKQAQPQKPTPPQAQPNQAQKPPPQPPQPNPKQQPPTPPTKAPPQVDPDTGLPVLPALNVPTMAPQNSAAQPLAPAPSPQQQAASVHGSLGRNGDASPAAMATVLGKYKQMVYNAVGSRWYPKVNNSFQVLGVGGVHVQFTIYADGSVTTKVLDEGDSSAQMLLSISLNSIRESAPFDPFDKYPGLKEEIMKQQGGDGNSYTDDFTFSIYGH